MLFQKWLNFFCIESLGSNYKEIDLIHKNIYIFVDKLLSLYYQGNIKESFEELVKLDVLVDEFIDKLSITRD